MDSALETNEDFYVVLLSQQLAVKVLQRSAQVIILDTPVVTVAFQKTRLELPEEESGEGTVFQVCVEVLSPGILERPVDVYLTLEEGSATGACNGSPFVQCTNLSLLADSIVEEDESFSVILGSSDNGVGVDPTPLTVVILNNDFANVSLELANYTVGEDDGYVTVCASLEGVLERIIIVNMTTTEDSALANSDYSALTDYPLEFSASVDTACVNVSILEEDIVEPDQVFQIYLASYDPVILTPNSSASVTILDNDVLGIGLSSASVMASEVASPLSVAVVILSGSLELDVTVSVAAFSWVNDTATEDFDYRSLNKTITFPSGSGVGSMETFDVIIINDIIVEELLETFTLRLTTPTGAPVAVIELEVATAFIQEDLTDMLDYIDISTTLTFSSGTSSACVQLSTIDDSTYESTEGLSVELESTDSQVTVATPSVLVTIVDNDDVVLSLSAPESVCEGGGVVQICVTLETDIERDVEATIDR
ncbi:adhesion G-protein coupled receptor V1-like [Halichondria panicea]|uniref:adhesion G-protein coupled receptor V1-like n=1 Tax=Halichondria panicea TaxID=6063 RepID=UPI00312BAF8F